ncbi:MAG: ribosome small subunit-dependent GTPase A, partial [Bacteroidota bacterium]
MTGLVTKSTGLWYEVKVDDQLLNARLRGKFKLDGIKTT